LFIVVSCGAADGRKVLAVYRDQKFLESTRGRIVTLIRRASRTVEDLVRELDLTDNGVRADLAVLSATGLCDSEVQCAAAVVAAVSPPTFTN